MASHQTESRSGVGAPLGGSARGASGAANVLPCARVFLRPLLRSISRPPGGPSVYGRLFRVCIAVLMRKSAAVMVDGGGLGPENPSFGEDRASVSASRGSSRMR